MPKRKRSKAIASDTILELDCRTKIKVGHHVDFKPLLSTKHRNYLFSCKDGKKIPVSSLVGKYILVLCFVLPYDKDDAVYSTWRCIEALYDGLSWQGVADDVKLVAVVKMAPRTYEPDFDYFFSKLSLDCLTIPFSDHESRNKVCQLLDMEFMACIAVNPSGMVLQDDPSFLESYGARCFPFTEEHFDQICEEDEKIEHRLRSTYSPISLGELLQCNFLSQLGDENKSIPISKLQGKLVGLYLCYDTFEEGFMGDLKDIHKKCVDKGFEIEIVLVPLPFGCHYSPKSFYKRVKRRALKDSITSSWWVFPFNDKICRTLWRIFHCYEDDQLIIMPHGGRLGDLLGRHVLSFYGIDAYPFTRDAIVERKVRELRSFTLEELLGDAFVPRLLNKNVLLCLDHPKIGCIDGRVYKELKDDYHNIKVEHPDSEVVLAPLSPVSRAIKRGLIKMGWVILPVGMSDTVANRIFLNEMYPDEFFHPALVAFGKDGKILSREPCLQPESVFDDTLGDEIFDEIRDE